VATKVHGNPAHPHTDGALCTKVSRYTERTYHPSASCSRSSAAGPKGQRPVERVSWEAALADIAADSAPLPHVDRMPHRPFFPTAMLAPWGWCRVKASRHAFSTSSAPRCWTAPSAPRLAATGLTHTLGGKVGMRVEFFAESKLIIIWGSNSITSNLHFWRYAQEAKRNGCQTHLYRPAQAPRRPTSATNTSPCCRAPTPRWPSASCTS
jgi:anaerobic selenocysteine-containing dehydrogenase